MALEVKRLFETLQAADREARPTLEDEIIGWGTCAIEFLITAMSDSEAKTRYQATRLLGKIATQTSDPRLIDPMIAALDSPDFMIRQIAAQILGVLGDRRAAAALIKALKDEKVLVQLWAVESLGKLGVSSAVDPLVELLQSADSATLRHTIIRALGLLGNPAVIPIILAFKDDEDAHVRSRVADAVQTLQKNA